MALFRRTSSFAYGRSCNPSSTAPSLALIESWAIEVGVFVADRAAVSVLAQLVTLVDHLRRVLLL